MQMAQASENTGGLNPLKIRLSGTIDHLDGFGPRAFEEVVRALRFVGGRLPIRARRSVTARLRNNFVL